MNIECYDLHWSWKNDEPYLEALLPQVDGKFLYKFSAPFKPYCYIESQQYESAQEAMQICGCWPADPDEAPDNFLKVEANHPKAITDFRDRFAFQTYEADVYFERRAAIDLDVSFLRPESNDIMYFDIEVDDRGKFTEAADADSRILSIAAIDGDKQEFYFDDKDEVQLIRNFLNTADNYIVLAGWNSLAYDFPYLQNRCAEILDDDIDWREWVLHDVMPLYDMLGVPTKTVSLKIDDVGMQEFDQGKTEVSAGDGTLYELWNRNPDILQQYNMRDAKLVMRIDEKYGLIDLLHVICDICNYPPGEACYQTRYGQVRFAIGQVVDAKLLSVAHQKNIPQPNKQSYQKPSDFPGGYVLDPTPGLYDDVVVPDYSGMYPNIVRAWNFGRETWVSDDVLHQRSDGEWEIMDGKYRNCRAIKGETGGFVHPNEGPLSVPAEVADDLVSIRDGAPEIIDKGVKAVNNTLYGVFAADHQRYFGKHSENITLIGQKLTETVERIANQGHPKISSVVYGDTDSVMIEMNISDYSDIIEDAHMIASDIEQEMQEWAHSRGAIAKYLKLDVDDVYDRFYIGNRKKRYFGHRIYSGGREVDDIKVRGFETRQGNWPQPVRDFQKSLMKAKLKGGSIRTIIETARNALYSGKWDFDMATSTKLNKPLDEYETTLPHTRAAEEIRSRHGQSAVKIGDKVNYIKYGPDKSDVLWIHDNNIGMDFRENEGWCEKCNAVVKVSDHSHETADYPHLRQHHYEYLWRHKFQSVMTSIDVSEYENKSITEFLE